MAVNLAKSVARHVATGGRYASAEVQAERKAICFGNACGKHDAARDRCLVCGCRAMDLKRSMASERCPLKPPKWGAV